MLKQAVFYVVMSLLVVIFAKYAHLIIIFTSYVYNYLHSLLRPLFSQLELGTWAINSFLLIILPILISLVPAVIYRLIKGKNMPHFISVVWIIWFFIVLSHILIH